jgi:TonB family protein
MQFAHFGVLNDGAQSKASTLTAIVINVLLAFVIVVVGAAAKKTMDNRIRLTKLEAPVLEKKIEPLKPKVIPPKLPKLPDVPKIEVQTPKIVVPEVKLPDPPKMPEVKMEQPKPVVPAAAPQKIVAPPAPKVVSLANPQAAAVQNHDLKPTAVQLGNATSPVHNMTGPAVATVNLAAGAQGMPPGNTGNGPTKVSLGNGQPTGTAMTGARGPVAVAGIPHGTIGGTGTAKSGPAVVQMGQVQPPPMPKPAVASSMPQRSAPKVVYKPKPVYTAEAMQLHLEGVVSVRIRVLANGSVEVINVTSGLGHGLDESAVQAVRATKFQPATDASGNPISWDGVVNVAFQLAG